MNTFKKKRDNRLKGNYIYISLNRENVIKCNMFKGPVKIYRSRGPVQNAWGQGLFFMSSSNGTTIFFELMSMEHQLICKVDSMGSILFFEHDTMWS